MSVVRASHTATLLDNGKVLVTGGQGSNDPASADLYDPATGTFTATGRMTSCRFLSTATLLNNGKVLIAGGSNDCSFPGTYLATAELFDPSAGAFTATGNMTIPRFQQTATLLNNGKVLIAGGRTFTVGVAGETVAHSAELYDPATGTFTATGNMTAARAGHTATLLNNGTVLLAGGAANNVTLNSAELFNPSTGAFTATGSMITPRYEHAGTLLNNGMVLFAGDQNAGAIAELYDPATGTFAGTGNMTIDRSYFSATLLNDGMVLFAGGLSYTLGIVSSAELYDPLTATFAATASMRDAREFPTGTLLNNGQVLVAGGQKNYGFLASAELYALPALSLSTTMIAFGNETTGITSATQGVTLTNNLPIAINFTSIAVTGTNVGDFMQSNGCVPSLAARASCTVNMTFTPTATGSRSASVTITDDATGSPQTISLTGTGTAPAPAVSLSSLIVTFTNQLVGTTSASQQVMLNNTGHAALTISSIAVTGTNSGDFSQSSTCGSSVAAGASCTINVSFQPTATGTRTASIIITDNASDSPQNVSLTGSGVAPVATFSATTVSFTNQAVGTSSAAQGLYLTNNGTGTLTISSVAINGANAGDFSQTNNCAAGAPSGLSCQFSITFRPSTSGTRTASMMITDNASGSPHGILLTGNAVGPVASLSPSSIKFPNQFVGTSGLPQTVTLMNTGAAPLVIVSVTTSPSDFGQVSSCGNSLSPGSSCAIGVFFDPVASGGRTGTLTITDNAIGSPQTVTLSGAGEDFSLVPASKSSATVAPGQTASYPISVVPSGGFSQTVAFVCTGAPTQSTCAVSPSTVALNGSAAVTVSVTVRTTAASRVVIELPASSPPPIAPRTLFLISVSLGLGLLAVMLASSRERHLRLGNRLALLLLICAGITMASCGGSGGSGNQGTPAGNYTLAVSATFTSGSTTLTHNTNLSLVVQ
jgi:hypothetical protein